MFTRPVVRPARPGDEPVQAARRARAHWHRFRWVGDEVFSGSSLYACRCGVVRPAP